MGNVEREWRHQFNLERINSVQRVVGTGDRLRIDHEGTLFERARLLEEEVRSHQASEWGLAAFDRLLRRLEEHDTAHAQDIAQFLAAVWNNQPLPLATLRGVGADVGDDMVAVLDAFRWGRLSLVEQVPGGAKRLKAVIPV